MALLKKGIGVVGSTTIDEIVSPDQTVKKMGGATTYAGLTYGRHAIDTFIISNLAPVDHNIIDRMKRHNIAVLSGKTDRTTHFINHIKGDSRRQQVINRARPILLRQLLPALDDIDGLHISPLHPDDIEPTILTELPHSGLKFFIDLQGYTRRVVNRAVSAAVSHHLPAALKAADIIKANESEIKLVLDYFQKDLPEIMEIFEIEEAVITSGAKGGWVEIPGGEKFVYAAQSFDTVIDPTGAGDVFFAAYLLSRFIKNHEISRSSRYAAGVAARQVAGGYIPFDRLVLS